MARLHGDQESAAELKRNEDGAGRDQHDADPVEQCQLLPEEDRTENGNQHDAELVDRATCAA